MIQEIKPKEKESDGRILVPILLATVKLQFYTEGVGKLDRRQNIKAPAQIASTITSTSINIFLH